MPLTSNTNIQPIDSDLSAVAGLSSNGVVVRTGTGTMSARTITGTSGQVTVTNGDGVSGSPTLSSPTTVTRVNKTFANFATAGLTTQVTLLALPLRSIIEDVKMVVITPGDTVATLTFSVGITGNAVKYMAIQNGLAAGNTITAGTNLNSLELSATNVIAEAISTVSNLNQMAQGSWDFYISYRTY